MEPLIRTDPPAILLPPVPTNTTITVPLCVAVDGIKAKYEVSSVYFISDSPACPFVVELPDGKGKVMLWFS